MIVQDARDTDAAVPAIDMEFLLDALSRPSHQKEAQRLFNRGVTGGWIKEHHVSPYWLCASF